MFDYGRVPATWSTVPNDPYAFDATDGGRTLRLMSDLNLGIEGGLARARHRIEKGETRFCALSWSRLLDGPRTAEEASAALDRDERVLARLAGRRRLPRPPLAQPPASAAR